MFKRAFFFTFSLIAWSAFAVYWFHIRLEPHDIAAYEHLVEESSRLRAKRAFEDEPAVQTRENVQKDIWTHPDVSTDAPLVGRERHFQIKSAYSELILHQKKDKMEAIEKLKQLTLQDDFLLTADEGLFTLPSAEFIGQGHCHLTKGQNSIDGDQIQLNLLRETVTYHNPHGHLADGLEFTAKTLIWNKKENKLYLNDKVTIREPDQSTLIANSGLLTLNEFEPQLLTLQGNVRVISTRINDKESYAIADTLTYNPQEKTLLLHSPKKVLFWQEGLNLSASEVLIRENQVIEGHGNVHFSFDIEEQNYIDQFFQQYL